ncbi:helix-turn-helix transcriptional regulator [Kribbella sp. NBC_00889]|uniref:helix-turn-helix transcriptional regulator n=1 Tax=Kribbella sp. NBC_00889 TaxID=2975974 RepID=UPI00386A50E3|nr:YafY family transcriptional regulator [Kribbella sp. NBC_00889]
MLETSARLLRLLSLLQVRRDWAGPELAGRLGVSTRTLRADVERLRVLGYPVEGRPGVAGGYRLGAGGELPPLLLDDEEAVAVAVGLRTAAAGGVAGIEETSVRALVKLEQVLPSRLRHRVRAVAGATVAVGGGGPRVDAEVLTAIASAIRDRERLRFDYAGGSGGGVWGDAPRGDEAEQDDVQPPRVVEPHRLVAWGRRWYLVAWDNGRDAWRTFRVDRMTVRTPNGARFVPRELDEVDVEEFVRRSVGEASWHYRARIRVEASSLYVQNRMPIPIEPEVVDDNRCIVELGSDDPHQLALWLGLLDADFEVLDAPELAEAVRAVGDRFHRAARAFG